MENTQIHVIKVPTDNDFIFPYSHYSDEHHNPFFMVNTKNNNLKLEVRDLFKMKPNYQTCPKNRIDIYIPVSTALYIGDKVIRNFGAGELGELNNIDPENFRGGPQTLPKISESRKVFLKYAEFTILGITYVAQNTIMYIDNEKPAAGHVEMKGKEIHFGIPLFDQYGKLDKRFVIYRETPDNETKVYGETKNGKKAIGYCQLKFNQDNARNLASTLIKYSK